MSRPSRGTPGQVRVLIVEDDFRVAQVHVSFTERVPGFTVVATARSAAEAVEKCTTHRPDLVLLDVYLPDRSGLDLLPELDADTMMLTAAGDPASVRTAFRRGALNYLLKPFTAEQLGDRLDGYARYRSQVTRNRPLSQEEVDRAVRVLHDGDHQPTPKGQSPVTIRLVADALREAGQPRSASDIAAQLGIARATAQRYLAALAQGGAASMSLRYGSSGRPEHLYVWSDTR